MEYYNLEEGKYPVQKEQNKDDEFFGDGWSVKKEYKKYTFSYLSGDHKGELKQVEISEEDYNLLVSGKNDLTSICLKYNVY